MGKWWYQKRYSLFHFLFFNLWNNGIKILRSDQYELNPHLFHRWCNFSFPILYKDLHTSSFSPHQNRRQRKELRCVYCFHVYGTVVVGRWGWKKIMVIEVSYFHLCMKGLYNPSRVREVTEESEHTWCFLARWEYSCLKLCVLTLCLSPHFSLSLILFFHDLILLNLYDFLLTSSKGCVFY